MEIVPLWLVLLFLFLLGVAVVRIAKPLFVLVVALPWVAVLALSFVFMAVWTTLNAIGSRLGFYIPSRTMGERGVSRNPANPHGGAAWW